MSAKIQPACAYQCAECGYLMPLVKVDGEMLLSHIVVEMGVRGANARECASSGKRFRPPCFIVEPVEVRDTPDVRADQ